MPPLDPNHAPLAPTEDRRAEVRRRAPPIAVSALVAAPVVVAVALLRHPTLVSITLVAFGVGLVLGRRLSSPSTGLPTGPASSGGGGDR